MPRSKRRCAVSLHEVAKCTVPRRWSASSCASADGAKDAAVAAIVMADASLNDVSLNDVSLNMGPPWLGSTDPNVEADPIRAALARQFPHRPRPFTPVQL